MVYALSIRAPQKRLLCPVCSVLLYASCLLYTRENYDSVQAARHAAQNMPGLHVMAEWLLCISRETYVS